MKQRKFETLLTIGVLLVCIGGLISTIMTMMIDARVASLEQEVSELNVYTATISENKEVTTSMIINETELETVATITDATPTDVVATITDAVNSEGDAIATSTDTDKEQVESDSIETTTEELDSLENNGQSDEIYIFDGTMEDIPNPVYNPPMTEYEYSLICQVVECETHGGDRESKAHIVHVIRNRIARSEWGNTWSSVILEPYQFGRRTDVTQDTIDAVNYALSIADTTYGSIAFHSGGYCSTFFGYAYVFTDAVGHKFYR